MSPLLSSYITRRRCCLFIPSLVLQAVTLLPCSSSAAAAAATGVTTTTAFLPFNSRITTIATATSSNGSSKSRLADATKLCVLQEPTHPSTSSPDYSSSSSSSDEAGRKPVLRPLIVCGPSGVGKGTIISQYMTKFGGSNHFGFTVSHTTRQPREGEINGTHYHFVSHQTMRDAISKGKFLEYAEVHGNLYGTSLRAVMHVEKELGKVCLLDIDVQGVKKIKERQKNLDNNIDDNDDDGENDDFDLEANFVFIAPPSFETLRERLIGRGTETDETIERRTKNAKAELEYGLQDGNFDHVIVNGDLDQACRDFDEVVRGLYGDFL